MIHKPPARTRTARLRESKELAERTLEELDMSASELAETLGMPRSTISRWLSGDRVMSAAARTVLRSLTEARR